MERSCTVTSVRVLPKEVVMNDSQRTRELRDYIVGAAMDDYESIETLQEQSKFVPPFDNEPPSVEELENEISFLIRSGLIKAYVYSRSDNVYRLSSFSTKANEEFWFLATK
jgi:hypothetical protein